MGYIFDAPGYTSVMLGHCIDRAH